MNQQRQEKYGNGFTIVELLIVVVVIAILAAITIVSYNGITNRAKSAAVQSAVSQAGKKVTTHATLNGDLYPATLSEVGINDSDGMTYQYSVNNSTNPGSFCITGTKDSVSYYLLSNAGGVPSTGTCAGAMTPVVASVGTATSILGTDTIQLTTTAPIPSGDVIAVGLVRGVTGSTTGGSASFTISAGATGTSSRASAMRSGVAEANLIVAQVTTTIPSGTTVTVTTSGNNTNRAALSVARISNVSSATPDATSGQDALGINGTSHAGTHASAATLVVPTDAATTVSNAVVIGLYGFNSSVTWSFPVGQTQVDSLVTSAGSADRGLLFGYKNVTSSGVQTMTANASASGAVTGVVMALPY